MRNQLVIDISHYQPRFDGALLKAAGVVAVIAKSSQDIYQDKVFSDHMATCLQTGLLPMAYHWADPIGDWKAEVKYLVEQAKKAPALFWWIDAEQWWSNWGSWLDAIRGKLAMTAVSVIAPQKLSDYYYAITSGLADAGYPVGVYSSYGFVTGHAPGMSKWIGQYPFWAAHYGRQPSKTVAISWEEFKRDWLPTYQPLVPPGASNLVGHQFTGDRFKLPGVYSGAGTGTALSALDVNLFEDGFIAGLKGQADPEPEKPKTTEERLDALEARVSKLEQRS